MQTEMNPLAVLMHDMHLAGVTDVVVDSPFNFTCNKIENPFVDFKPSDIEKSVLLAPSVATPSSNLSGAEVSEVPTHKTARRREEKLPTSKVRALEELFWHFGEQKAAVQVILSSNAKAGFHPLALEAKALFEKMLLSIGLKEIDLGYTVLNSASSFNKQEKQLVYDALLNIREGARVLFVGEDAVNFMFEKGIFKARLSDHTFREKPCGLVMHPESLIAQPLLKKLAWQDLLKFKNLLEGGS